VVTAEHILEKTNMPEDLIRDVSGQVAFEEEDNKVHPITAFSDDVIKSVSTNHIGIHADKFNEYKILRQRHQVRIVPVSKVNFDWKGKKSLFCVYGYENKVFLPSNSYPQSCCWGCNIL